MKHRLIKTGMSITTNDRNGIMKRDILFVNPPLSNQERYGVKSSGGGQTPPTGLCMLAAVCREANYSTAILDAACLGLALEETADRIFEYRPKYVGITSSSLAIYNAEKLSWIIKKQNPSIKIILGGPHITAVPNETVQRMGQFFDVAVLREGERTILDLLDALENNYDLSEVKGIGYFKGQKLVLTWQREYIEDLDQLPFPAWDLLPNMADYYRPPVHTVKEFPAALLITSRGCPGQCTFCDNKVFGRTLRTHSAKYIIDMIKHLQTSYGVKEVQFRDDNFMVFRKRNMELCNRIIEEKLDIVWSCAGRVDMVDPKLLQLMNRAGCWQIWYGIESGCDRVLQVIHKYTNQEDIEKAVVTTKKAGISPAGFFIIGLPTETEEDIKETIRVMLKLSLDEFHWGFLTPLPGSEIYAEASQYGYFENDWKKMSGWNIVFVPENLTKEKILYYCNLAYRKFYFRPRIIINYLKKIRSWRHVKYYLEGLMGLLQLLRRST